MTRALVLGDQRVASIMTCRKDIVTLEIDMSTDDIKRSIASELHDTYPVLDENHEEIKGTVSLKDLILTLDSHDFELNKVLSPGTFIPERHECI